MSRSTILAVAIFVSSVSLACSESSPLAPVSTVADGRDTLEARAAKPPGVYELSFEISVGGSSQPLDPLVPVPVGTVIRATATVRDRSVGLLPVSDGTIMFDQCVAKGDPAPLEACETGSGHWSVLARFRRPPFVGPAQSVELSCDSPTTFGIRFRYVHGFVADGSNGPVNLVWN